MPCPRPAVVAVRRGRRNRRCHRPGSRARRLGALEPGRDRPGGEAWSRTAVGGELAFWQPKRRRRMNERPAARGRARGGDEDAFARLVEPHRRALHAHCYRMLGSVADAEDALQDALLAPGEGSRSSRGEARCARGCTRSRPTPACERSSGGRSGCCRSTTRPPPTRTTALAEPLVESVWLEPYPDERHGLEDGLAGPEARYEQRESVELAFIAALQHLPARQRAVLILRDVLGFSARETAAALETMSSPGVDSALQRAHKAVDERLPDRSQQAVLGSLDDQRPARDRRPLRRRLRARRRRRRRRDARRRRRRSRCRPCPPGTAGARRWPRS